MIVSNSWEQIDHVKPELQQKPKSSHALPKSTQGTSEMAENNSPGKSVWQICHDAAQGDTFLFRNKLFFSHILEFLFLSYATPKDVYLIIERKEKTATISVVFLGRKKGQNYKEALFSVLRDGQGQSGCWRHKFQCLLMF